MAMLTALSVVLVTNIHLPLIPTAAFLEYDPADIPVLICSLMLGPVAGLITLLAVCIIQAITVSASSGIIGFFMHFIASAVLVLVASGIYNRKKTTASLILGLVAGSLAMTVVMIPLNIVFTGIFMGINTQFEEIFGAEKPVTIVEKIEFILSNEHALENIFAQCKTVINMLIPAIIPFNLLKAGINSAITFAVFTPISHVLKKYIKVGKK